MTAKLSARRMAIACACVLASPSTLSAAAADTVPPPDPATVMLPDIATSDPKTIADGYKFYVFHNPAIDFATAYADIADCRSFLPGGTGRWVPTFTPWQDTPLPAPARPGLNPYGLVGDVIAAIVLPKLNRGQASNIMRRCMETRGYVRYPVTEAIWDALNDVKNPAAVAMQAKIATGPKPPQAEVIDQ